MGVDKPGFSNIIREHYGLVQITQADCDKLMAKVQEFKENKSYLARIVAQMKKPVNYQLRSKPDRNIEETAMMVVLIENALSKRMSDAFDALDRIVQKEEPCDSIVDDVFKWFNGFFELEKIVLLVVILVLLKSLFQAL